LTLVVLCGLAFATYVIAPTTPPWLAQPTSVRHLIEDTIQRSGLPANLVWLYSHHDYNLYAAFPSLHAGFPVVAAFAAWQRSRWIGLLLTAWAVVVWVSVVYLGEHYVADVVGGIAYAMVAILIGGIFTKRLLRRQHRVTVPPPAGSHAP
jgi:membrane-associated phospholipid phosphatase